MGQGNAPGQYAGSEEIRSFVGSRESRNVCRGPSGGGVISNSQLHFGQNAIMLAEGARERCVLDNLLSLDPRPTFLLVSHRAESFAACDRVITLTDGHVATRRSPR